MKYVLNGALAALALMMTVSSGMADSGPSPKGSVDAGKGSQQFAFDSDGCWVSSGTAAHEAFGRLKPTPYLWASIRPVSMDGVDPANLTPQGTFKLDPGMGVIKDPKIKQYPEYKGFNSKGMGVFVVPEELSISIMFYVDEARTQAVAGKIEVCISDTFE